MDDIEIDRLRKEICRSFNSSPHKKKYWLALLEMHGAAELKRRQRGRKGAGDLAQPLILVIHPARSVVGSNLEKAVPKFHGREVTSLASAEKTEAIPRNESVEPASH